MEEKSEKSLTAKQEAFCQEYLKDFNATQAAIRAGYSKHTAKEMGCENLAKSYLSKRIDALKESKELAYRDLCIIELDRDAMDNVLKVFNTSSEASIIARDLGLKDSSAVDVKVPEGLTFINNFGGKE